MKESSFSTDELKAQQDRLESDLEIHNNMVKATALEKGVTHINLHKEIQKIAIKWLKRKKNCTTIPRYSFDEIPDGVHPSKELNKTLFNKVAAAYRHLTAPSIGSTESESTVDEEKESWNFKKRRPSKHQ